MTILAEMASQQMRRLVNRAKMANWLRYVICIATHTQREIELNEENIWYRK